MRLAVEHETDKWANGVFRTVGRVPVASLCTIGEDKSWSVAANVTSVLGAEARERGRRKRGPAQLDNDWEDPERLSLTALGLEGFQGMFPADYPYAHMSR